MEARRFDELVLDTTFVICREPERGKQTVVSGIMAIPIDAWFSFTPDFVLYYRYDDNNIWLLSIQLVDE